MPYFFSRVSSPYVPNGLAALGLVLLYYLFCQILRQRSRSEGRFYGFACVGWIANILYLWCKDVHTQFPQQCQHLGLPYVAGGLIVLSNYFFLLGSSVTLRRQHPRLYSPLVLAAVLPPMLVLRLIEVGKPEAEFHILFHVVEIIFNGFAIGSLGFGYRHNFRTSALPLRSATRALVTLPIYLYALLQLALLLPDDRQTPAFLAGAAFKLLHLAGLVIYSGSFFKDYEEKRRYFHEKGVLVDDAIVSTGLRDTLAHELGTPAAALRLTAESSLADACERDKSTLTTASQFADQIVQLVDVFRVMQITEEKVEYPGKRDVYSINVICDSAISSLALADIGRDVTFQRNYSAGCKVYARRMELLHILRNLFKNACEAVAHCARPRIVITTSIASKPASSQEVIVRIADNGPGIDINASQRIFEDGFSTKAEGFGHGHGLYIARSFAAKSGGSVDIESLGGAENGGAVFELRLPYCDHAPGSKGVDDGQGITSR